MAGRWGGGDQKNFTEDNDKTENVAVPEKSTLNWTKPDLKELPVCENNMKSQEPNNPNARVTEVNCC